jgi:YD repeat-containing protein
MRFATRAVLGAFAPKFSSADIPRKKRARGTATKQQGSRMRLASIRRFSFARGAAFLAAMVALISAAYAGNVVYTIDPASGRLTKATYADGSYITYNYDANGNRTSAVLTLAQDTTPPSAPGTPGFTGVTETSATASWAEATDNVAVTSYEWSRNAGSTWNTVGTARTASITGLSAATSYTILVRAKDAAPNTGPTSQNSFTTPDTSAPGAPGTPLFSSITATSATASWTAATDNVAVTSYEWSRNGGSTWTSVGTARTVTFNDLTGQTNYTVMVRAKDAATNIGPTSSNSFTTLDNGAPTAPGIPTFSNVTATSATATWTAATDSVAVTGYEYSLNGGAWTSNGMALSVNLGGLSTATGYTFRVRARDGASNIGPESTNSFTTLDNVAPSAPGTPSFSSIAQNSATASWAAATDNVAVTSYEYSLNGGAWTSNGASLSRNFTGLSSGASYTLQVRAQDAANNPGTASSNSFSTLDNVAPSAPGTPSFSGITGTSATASWTAATDNVGVTSYEYSLNGGSWTSNGLSLSKNFTGLTPATSYTVQVRALDGASNPGSASSNSFTTVDTVAPSAPGTPTFSNVTGNSATASWSVASDNVAVTSYEYSINGGSSWTNVGNTTSATISGLSAAATTTVLIRALDAAGNPGSSSSGSVTTIAQITISNRSVWTLIPGLNGSSAQYQLSNTGDIMTTQSNSATLIDVGDWLVPKTGIGSFQVMATLVSSSACSFGTMNTWLNLSSSVGWVVGRGGPSGNTGCTFDIQIRHSSNPSAILGTARIIITASN